MPRSFDFPNCKGLTAAAIGPPGHRIFMLQASDGETTMTLRLEKQQVALLSGYLDSVMSSEDFEIEPAEMPAFDESVSDWIVGSLLVAVTEDNTRVVVVAEELVDDPDSAGHTARVALTPGQVAAFVTGAADLVARGRPQCPLCGAPMDPEGHGCPRLN